MNEESVFRYDGGTSFDELDGATGLTRVTLTRGGGMGGGIGSVLYNVRAGVGVEYFTNNAVGHTVALTDDAGSVTKTDLYEAFGSIVSSSGTSTNNRLANTKERDFSTGLDNHGFRMYDKEIGRYISRDPIGYGDGMNVYLYVKGNPIGYVDPEGLGLGSPQTLRKKGKKEIDIEKLAKQMLALQQAEKKKQKKHLVSGPMVFISKEQEEFAWQVIDTAIPHPEDTVKGGKLIGEAFTDEDVTWTHRGKKLGFGIIIAGFGLFDCIDLVPDPSDVVQKVVRNAADKLSDGAGKVARRLNLGEGLQKVVRGADVPTPRIVNGPPAKVPVGSVDVPSGGGHVTGGGGSGGGGFSSGGGAPGNEVPDVIYRKGKFDNPKHHDPRYEGEGISFRDSLSEPINTKTGGMLNEQPVFKDDFHYTAVDTSKLPPGSVVVDGVPGSKVTPPGHVSVYATPEQIVNATIKPPVVPQGKPVGVNVGQSGKFPKK